MIDIRNIPRYVKDKIENIKHKREEYKRDKHTKENLLNNLIIGNEKPKKVHDILYSDLLAAYTSDVGKTLTTKRRLKVIFFIIVMFIFVFCFAVFCYAGIYLCNNLTTRQDEMTINETIISIVGIALPALSSLIVALIKIPTIITRYLFNKEEELYMKEIIKNLQDYDRDVYKIDYEITQRLENQNINGDDNKTDDTMTEFKGDIVV